MRQIILWLAGALLAGCNSMHPQPLSQLSTLHYVCGTLPLTVTLDNHLQQVKLILDGTPQLLKATPAASGTRYANDTYVFWSKGNGAFVERNDKIVINDCQLQQ
ncbi:hypothetical protein BL250_04055 [Erwinia sp. OLTSP20]|uniref:MliC family protein n=1 Tax=unclassified Erwinia TaxID=2622719 RepID=UPI000C18F92D|nr:MULTISPECIES: MliC family protein [unclassified Erwinia]PIJ51735.1 hypothetical protein BV501_02985 [Erwinia sp. OAMSP11]PIJ75621.1 hypothetical protein BK416_01280 [Erwinia sp. OLSSP12]PIJ84926.1 hypothetical protein BLD47_01210 [Erwinia sp. OLCASP19]PIJ86706.1 hypothetical protein BLD46_02810 [Erwinia sp. OLMTSP26]PIJ88147.1 hypothetical protein BLD49_03490 [Erwinia sp. OLMDSP33]